MKYIDNMSEYRIGEEIVVVIKNEFSFDEAIFIKQNYIIPKNKIDRVEINNLKNIDLNGIQVLHLIRKTYPDIVIIIYEEDSVSSLLLLNSGLTDFFQLKHSVY